MTRRLYETTEDYHARLARGLTNTGVASPELREAVAQAACEAGHHAWPTTDGYNDLAEKRAWLVIADAVLAVLVASHEQMRKELEAYRSALTPSGETKALLMGEFWEEIEVRNPDYEGESDDSDEEDDPEFVEQRVPVQWTTIKAIMQSIRQHAEACTPSTSNP